MLLPINPIVDLKFEYTIKNITKNAGIFILGYSGNSIRLLKAWLVEQFRNVFNCNSKTFYLIPTKLLDLI